MPEHWHIYTHIYIHILNKQIFFKKYIYLYVSMQEASHACGCQNTTFKSQVPPSIILILASDLRSSGLLASTFTDWAFLLAHYKYF